jgi:dGTPase
LIRREEVERRESELLAPYAAKSAESRGRVYPAVEHPLRTAFQRDRDRVVHSAAFRRMEYKTQVFLPHEGDHFRTRLTHTLEVAQISRTIARALGLNEDLTEAVALVHDLGHTPFGHAGEDILDGLLKDHGGFNHNRQSLRVVDLIEQRYPDHPGLNLSFEIREGIAKHETKHRIVREEFDPELRPTLEASLVDLADEIAYNAHDIDDGLRAGLISIEGLRPLTIWGDTESDLFAGRGVTGKLAEDQKRYLLVRRLVDSVATDVLSHTEHQLQKLRITDLDSARRSPERLCGYSDSMAARVDNLKLFLRDRLYRHQKLMVMTQRAERIITALFARLCRDHTLLPERYQEMILSQESPIVVADYIAGMTDRFAERLYDTITSDR